MTEILAKGNTYIVKLPKGHFEILINSSDMTYPGIDIEYIPDDKDQEGTNPRVVIEMPIYTDKLDENDTLETEIKALLWNDPKTEDSTENITLGKVTITENEIENYFKKTYNMTANEILD